MQKRGIIEMQMLMFALALVAASTQVRAQGRHPCDLTAQPLTRAERMHRPTS